MKRLSLLAVFALLIGVMAFVVMPSTSVAAQENEQSTEEAQEGEVEATEEVSEVYEYTAQPGDAYIQMARKAVQTYGVVNEVDLSLEQIVFAETELAKNASFPVLNEGEMVSFNVEAVKTVVEQAQQLTEEQQAAWAYYVSMIDFNTDAIGQ
jgi:hypothetical protein